MNVSMKPTKQVAPGQYLSFALQLRQAKVDVVKAFPTEIAAELDAMLPAILDKAFKRGL